MKKIFAIIILFFAGAAYGLDTSFDERTYNFTFNEGTYINIATGSDGVLVPSAKFPIYFGSHFYAELGADMFNTSENKRLSSFQESRNSVTTKETVISLTPIGYRSAVGSFTFAAGLNYTYRKTDRLEFGYVHMPAVLGGDWVSFENDVKLNMHHISAQAIAGYSVGMASFSIYGVITPWQILDIKQDTMMKPIVADNAKLSSSSNGGLSYRIGASAGIKFADLVGLKGSIAYEFIPLEYDLKLLNYNTLSSTFYFEKDTVKEEETKLIYGLHLFIPALATGGLSPSIGVEIRDIKNKDKSSGNTTDSTETLFSVGMVYSM
jgi:hypothetical protein